QEDERDPDDDQADGGGGGLEHAEDPVARSRWRRGPPGRVLDLREVDQIGLRDHDGAPAAGLASLGSPAVVPRAISGSSPLAARRSISKPAALGRSRPPSPAGAFSVANR